MNCLSAGTPQPIDYTLDPLPTALIIQLLRRWTEGNVLDNATIVSTETVALVIAVIPKSVHRHLNTHLWWFHSAATRRQRITEGMYKLKYFRRIGGGSSPVDAKPPISWGGPAVSAQYLQLPYGKSRR